MAVGVVVGFGAEEATIYAFAKGRGHEVPEAIPGKDFDGVLVVDGWSAYNVLACRKGRCHAHILRRCHALLEQQPSQRDKRLLKHLVESLRAGPKDTGSSLWCRSIRTDAEAPVPSLSAPD